MAPRIRHSVVTGASADPTALVDGVAWDADHNITNLTAADVTFTPTGGVSSATVQTAIAEVDTEKAAISSLAAVAFSGATADVSYGTALNLTSGQIAFPATQSASTDVNTLDDYEEGTFTPVFTAATPPTGVTYGTQTGYYTKIGNRVFCDIRMALTSKGTGGVGNVSITGLPFTAANFTAPWASGLTIGSVTYPASTSQMAACVTANAAALTFIGSGSGVAAATSAWADWSDTSTCRISFSYRV